MDFLGFLDYLDFLNDADETIAYAQAGGFPQTSRVGFLRRAHQIRGRNGRVCSSWWISPDESRRIPTAGSPKSRSTGSVNASELPNSSQTFGKSRSIGQQGIISKS